MDGRMERVMRGLERNNIKPYCCLDRYAPGLTDDEIKSAFLEAMGDEELGI